MTTTPRPVPRPAAERSAPRAAITSAWALEETTHVQALLALARQPAPGWGQAGPTARTRDAPTTQVA